MPASAQSCVNEAVSLRGGECLTPVTPTDRNTPSGIRLFTWFITVAPNDYCINSLCATRIYVTGLVNA